MNERTRIHPTAVVAPDCRIADDAIIGPYCVIGEHVEIGPRTVLHNHVTIHGPTVIGEENIIYPFCVIGADPQDLKYHGEEALCVIGDRNRFREHITIHRGTEAGGGVTRIGSDNLFMVASHVAHDCIIGSRCVIANSVMLGGHVIVEDGANIGGGAGVHHYSTVGTMAFVGGLTRVKRDVPPYTRFDGDPGEVRGLNTIALTRHRFSPEEIAALRQAYRLIFRKAPAGIDAETNSVLDQPPAPIYRSETVESLATMSERIDLATAELGHFAAVRKLCDSLIKSGFGVHGRAAESTRAR